MRASWMAIGLIGSVVAVGCGDRTSETTENFEQTGAAVPADPALQPGPQATAEPPAEPSERGATARRQDNSAVVRRDARPQSVPPAARPAAPANRPAAASAPAVRWRELTLPAGTSVPLELMTALSSETATVETPVRARVRQAVEVDGYVAIPAGTVLTGTVTDVARPGRVQGRSRLAIRFTEATLDGTREDVRTNPIMFEGEQTKGEDATKIGAGAVGGAIIGGILGGGDGAAKGAAIGGAAGTGAVLATRGRDLTLAAGTDIAATLAAPVTLRVDVR